MQMDGWMEGGRDKEKDGTGRESCAWDAKEWRIMDKEKDGWREGWMD